MFGRIFGRGKDDQDQAVCAECGRTLLAGEWTRTIVDDHGDERLICSLCGQRHAGQSESVAAAPAPANNGRVRETRSESEYDERAMPEPAPAPRRDTRAESDAFWQALKDKDAQIEMLKAQLARAEAERQELAGRFARLGSGEAAPAAEPGSLTGDSSEPGERTWGETPAEFATEMAALREATQAQAPEAVEPEPIEDEPAPGYSGDGAVAGADAEAVAVAEVAARAADETAPETAAPAAEDLHPAVFEDTQPIPAVDEDMLVESGEADGASTGEIAAAEAAAAVAAGGGALPGEPDVATAPSAPSVAEVEAAAASLTLLQRGVDLLNVSGVPRKIAETNEQLGLPHVHAGFDGETAAVTFMWSMGWYRFDVDLESGQVSMADRGYDELALQPNAGVRADGTVQLAPAQISRAAAHRAQAAEPAAEARPAPPAVPEAALSGPATPREAAQKAPEFLSKSLLGQRSDDAAASWEETKARDFDWDR